MTRDELRQSFVRSVIETPEDDAPRLIFADWLEDNEEYEYGEFIRVQCELHDKTHGVQGGDLPWQKRVEALRRRERELFNYKNVSEWFRHQAFLRNTVCPSEFHGLTAEGISSQFIRRGFVHRVHCPLDVWRGMECEECGGSGEVGVHEQDARSGRWRIRRCPTCGGTSRVNAHGPALVQAAPLEKVTLTEWQGESCRACLGGITPCLVCHGLYDSAACLAWAKRQS